MFKLYILNRNEAFFGFYPIAEHTVTFHGEPVPMYDLMGKDATTVTDVLAGLLGGVAVIGYANKPGKAETLSQAGARAVVTDLAEITTALRTAPSAPSATLPN